MKGLLAMNSQVSGQVGALRPGGGGGGGGGDSAGDGGGGELFELIIMPWVLCFNPFVSEVTTKKLKKGKARNVILLEVFMVCSKRETQCDRQNGTMQSIAWRRKHYYH
jgi:hypothetical protein